MAIVLYHHPWSRAANVVWMLEEIGIPYELRWVDIAQRVHSRIARAVGLRETARFNYCCHLLRLHWLASGTAGTPGPISRHVS